jgi:hypothetical protein
MKYILLTTVAILTASCAGQTTTLPTNVAVTPTSTSTIVTTPVSVSTTNSNNPLTQLANFTVADLKAASVDAKAQTPPDVTAYQCYDFLVGLIPTIQAPGSNQTVGAVLAFQKLRDLNTGAVNSSGALKSLNLACAPLVIDTQTTINKLLLLSAGGAATAGSLGPFAGGIGAIGASLPIPITLP